MDNANQRNIEVAKAHADADRSRYEALARIAESGDATAKVAATMALALGQAYNTRTSQIITPQAPVNEALQWASILVPSVTQLGMGFYNKQISINSSNNSRDIQLGNINKDTVLGIGYQNTFLGMSKEINSPVVVTNTNTSETAVIVKPEVVNPVVVNPVVVNPVIVQPTTAP